MAKARGTVLMYWDYELQGGADTSRYGEKTWGAEDFTQTVRILDLLDEYEMQATFAVIGFAALPGGLPYHAPEQVRDIAQRGHEVASHTWKHEWIPDLTYEELCEVLRKSKAQLEEVTGKDVISFAPPWNVPTKYMRKLAIGLYQRRRSKYDYIDIPKLCSALFETGYKTARISYETLPQNLSRHILGREIQNPTMLEKINRIVCCRVNAGGFGDKSLAVLDKVAEEGGFLVTFAHPHSLIADNNQNEQYLVPFLERVRVLRGQGKVEVMTPGELCDAG